MVDFKADLDKECSVLEGLITKREQLRAMVGAVERDITGRQAVVSYLSEKVKNAETLFQHERNYRKIRWHLQSIELSVSQVTYSLTKSQRYLKKFSKTESCSNAKA